MLLYICFRWMTFSLVISEIAVFHIETSHDLHWKLNDWFLYKKQPWTKLNGLSASKMYYRKLRQRNHL